MKNNIFLIFSLCLSLSSCDLSSFFKKEITDIIVPETIRMSVGQEVKIDLNVRPEKMTIPQWELTVPEGLEYIEKEVDPAMLKYDRIIRAHQRGSYKIDVREKSSNLLKSFNVLVLEQITDFTLPETKLVSLNAFFRLEDFITTVPESDVTYDFRYEFDSSLLTYDEQTGFFQAGSQPGDVSVLVTDVVSGLSKSCVVTVSDDYRIFDKIETDMLLETQLPEELVEEIRNNNLRIEYPINDGLFIDEVKYTFLTTKAKSWTVLFYYSVGNEEIVYGSVDIESRALEKTPFDPITLDVGIKQDMPQDLVQFIRDNDLEIDYENQTGLSIEVKDFTLLASDAGEWVVELCKTVNGERFVFAVVEVSCQTWFEVDFYYGQRVFVSEQWKMLDTDDELLDQLKKMENLDVTYSWKSGETVKALTRSETETLDKKIPSLNMNLNDYERISMPKCAASGYWKTYVTVPINNTFKYEEKNKNYLFYEENQNEFKYYSYNKDFVWEKEYFRLISNCHGAEGDGYGTYAHAYYIYPKEDKYAYSTLKTEVDTYFQEQIEKVNNDFAVEADNQQYDLESFYTATTDGMFEIRKNQDGGSYSETVLSGTEQNQVMTIEPLSTKNDSFSKIAFNATSITVTKSRSLEKEPRYPVIRKITARWKSDGLTYTGFLQELDETAHSVTISEHPDEKYIEIAVTEKDLSNDRCVIDAIVGYVMFEDLSGNTVSKRIEVRKE